MFKRTKPAILINNDMIYELVCCLDPAIGKLDYEKEVFNHFLVFNYPHTGKYMLISHDDFFKFWTHFENAGQLKFYTLHQKGA